MNENTIFLKIKHIIFEVVPELESYAITIDDSLRDLGANSIDRAEILIRSMATLNLKIPLIEFAQTKNIRELISIFLKHINSSG